MRWTIGALIFAATTMNLVDRQVLGILASDLQRQFGWNEIEYGYIVSAFQLTYALGMAIVGNIIDRIGTRLGYALSVILWSIVCAAHALVGNALGFGIARAFLGITEAGNFPAAIKATAEWFPLKERSFMAGFINAGSNMGVIVAALLVPFMALNYGWQSAFIVTGILGLMVGVLIWWYYRPPEQHKSISPQELAYIQADQEIPAKIKWIDLIKYRQLWVIVVMKFLVDPVWYFYLYWLPKYLDKVHGIPLGQLSLPLMTVYLMSDAGSIAGGWLPTRLMSKGMSLHRARKTTYLICAIAVWPMFFGAFYTQLWVAVLMVGLALAAQQAWSSNTFTLASDMFPKQAVAAATGMGGMAGALGGFVFANIIGWVLENTGSYNVLFFYAASAHSISFLVLMLMIPAIQKINLK